MTENSSRQNETALESWKEIAAYLKRDVRTVKRWEKAEALPVRRHLHQARSSVYAYPSELEAWKAARQPGFDQAPLAMPWRRPIPALGFALTLLLALVSVASGPILTPPGALAQESGGMTARQVWAGPDVDIMGSPSPDGRYLTFVDWNTGDLAVRDLTTGETHRLTQKGSWSESFEEAGYSIISPDGQQVAYQWYNKDRSFQLRLIGFDGSNPRVLYQSEEVITVFPHAWSPDGKYILGNLRRKDWTHQIVLIAVADGAVHALKTLDFGSVRRRMSFSPDGRYIAYDFPAKEGTAARHIHVLASDGSGDTPLIKHSSDNRVLGWSPDGKRILFTSDRTGSRGVWFIEVTRGKPQGVSRLVKRDVGRNVLAMGFVRDGSYYYGRQTGMDDVYIATLDLVKGKVLVPLVRATERFMGSNASPTWSPDGQYLAYVSRRGPVAGGLGSSSITIRSLATGEERELVPSLVSFGALRWSPDGRSFLVHGYDGKYRQGLYRIDAQAGDVTPLVQSAEAFIFGAVWSPDEKEIFYRRRDRTTKQSSLIVRSLETGEEKELYRVAAPSFLRNSALSRDGRQLALTTNDPTTRSEVLMVIPAAGGEPRELLRLQEPEPITPLGGLAWTPDGSQILFLRGRLSLQKQTFTLWRIPVQGGEPQKLELAMDQLRDMTLHPDGRRVAFTAGQYKAEVWVLENFLPKTEAQAARLEE